MNNYFALDDKEKEKLIASNNEVLQYIVNVNSGKEIFNLETLNRIIENDKNNKPFIKLFTSKMGTNIGEEMELFIERFFSDFIRVKGENFDGYIKDHNNIKFEIKSIRALNNKKEEDYINRSVESFDYKNNIQKITNQTFQQIKPSEFNYLIGLVVFSDIIEIYLIKNTEINDTTKNNDENKIILSPQHKGNLLEGSININKLSKKNIGCFYIEDGNIKIKLYDKQKELKNNSLYELINL